MDGVIRQAFDDTTSYAEEKKLYQYTAIDAVHKELCSKIFDFFIYFASRSEQNVHTMQWLVQFNQCFQLVLFVNL